MRPKTCPACREKFQPSKPMQKVCSPLCAQKHVEDLKAKKDRKETRERKAAAKTRQQWLKEAQAVFNRFIRLRDSEKPCISCGRHHEGQNHAGHFRSTGAAPELRFEEMNVHLQCQPCNVHKSGNLIEYRKGLVERIGAVAVQWLEGSHEPKKYTIDDLRQIKAMYQAKCKELEQQNG